MTGGPRCCSPNRRGSGASAWLTSVTICPTRISNRSSSRVASTGRLGGFHFNDSKYGDDDLTVGSIKPFQLFLIFIELLEFGGWCMPDIAYMIDESHNLKDPLEDLIQATDAIQHTLALAMCFATTN